MLKRKIEETLQQWKNSPDHLPLVIMGLRQCGKTFIVRKFARENFKYVCYINFIKQPKRIAAFLGSKEVDDILLELSTQIRGILSRDRHASFSMRSRIALMPVHP